MQWNIQKKNLYINVINNTITKHKFKMHGEYTITNLTTKPNSCVIPNLIKSLKTS